MGWESVLKPVPCSIAPESLTGIFRLIVPMPLRSPTENTRNFLGFGLTPCAASLSVEGSRLARRPPRKRRVAAFTPRSETTIGTGLNSSGRDDIQTMDRHVFRAVVLRCNGTENRVKMCRTVAGENNNLGSVFGGRCYTSSHFCGHVRSCGNVRIERRWNFALCCAGIIRPHVPHVWAHVQPIRAEKRQPRAGIVAQTCAAHVHQLAREKMHVQETCAARNQRGQKRNRTPD